MSTRVRIYELSKELNLENKEILNICETLDIAAKSHSSTITEEDAEAIRKAAPSSNGAKPAPKKKNESAKSANSSGDKSNSQKILAIKKQPDAPPEKPTSDSKPELVTPTSPQKPKAVSKPSRPEKSNSAAKPAANSP